MDSETTDAVLAAIDQVAANEDFAGVTMRADLEGRFPEEIWASLVKLGVPSFDLPEAHGGIGASVLDLCRVIETLGRHSIAASTSVFTFSGFGAHLFDSLPADATLRGLLDGIASGEVRTALGLTEASGGSDLSTMRTRLVPGPDAAWRLNGSKMYTTLAGSASHIVVGALLSGPDGRWVDRFALAVVERESSGITATRVPMEVLRSCPTYEVHFDDVEVPADFVIEPPLALTVLMSILNQERLAVAAQSCGLGQRALELARAYSETRIVFGSVVLDKQAPAHSLVEAWEHLTNARALVRAAAISLEGDDAGALATMAQRSAARAAHLAADASLQVHGGSGLQSDSEIQRIWRDTRLHLIGPITREASADYLARRFRHGSLQLPLPS
jgi:alkylation response protein AidB-like acyl-CoA dehydrogenase